MIELTLEKESAEKPTGKQFKYELFFPSLLPALESIFSLLGGQSLAPMHGSEAAELGAKRIQQGTPV
jgi:hypothetical protein